MNAEEQDRIVEAFLEPLGRVQPVALRDRAVAPPRRQWVPLVLIAAALVAAVVVVVVRRPVAAPTPTPAATTPAPTTVTPPVLVTVTALGIERAPGRTGSVDVLNARILAAVPSPDRSQIAYMTTVGNACRLRILDIRSWTSRDLADGCTGVDDDRQLVDRSRDVTVDGRRYELAPLAGPTWSPDGRTIVYGCRDQDAWACTIASDGTGGRRAGVNEAAPAFSPDGSQIAFLREAVGGFLSVWVANADGSSERRVATTRQECCLAVRPHLGWSSDGRWLAVSGARVETIDIATGRTRLIGGNAAIDNDSFRFRSG